MHHVRYLATAIIARLNHYLAQQNAYLIQENRILRSKLGKRITVTPEERTLLLRFAEPLGQGIKEIVSIVKPATFMRWVKDLERGNQPRERRKGRPLTKQEIIDLILRIHDENNGWGHRKVYAELKKLGIGISMTTVYNILKRHEREPGPSKEQMTWENFLKAHFSTLWACDFFTTKVWTLAGPVTYYALVYIHLESRRLVLGGITQHPNDDWMVRQGQAFVEEAEAGEEESQWLLMDQDRKYTKRWQRMMKANGFSLKFTSRYAPNMNAYIESAISTIKRECLNHFVICGERHLEHLLEEYLEYYNCYRPHRGLGLVPIDLDSRGCEDSLAEPLEDIHSVSFLGGLHHHYSRKAA